MIKVLFLIMSLFVFIFLEGFLLNMLSFSIFIVVVISLWKRIGDLWFYLFISLVSIALDTVLHMSLGTHMLVLGFLLVFFEFSWFLIPREGRFGYIPIFLFIFFYYILIFIVSSVLQDGIIPKMFAFDWLSLFIKSTVSVLLCILVNRLFLSLRDSGGDSNIRLK